MTIHGNVVFTSGRELTLMAIDCLLVSTTPTANFIEWLADFARDPASLVDGGCPPHHRTHPFWLMSVREP